MMSLPVVMRQHGTIAVHFWPPRFKHRSAVLTATILGLLRDHAALFPTIVARFCLQRS